MSKRLFGFIIMAFGIWLNSEPDAKAIYLDDNYQSEDSYISRAESLLRAAFDMKETDLDSAFSKLSKAWVIINNQETENGLLVSNYHMVKGMLLTSKGELTLARKSLDKALILLDINESDSLTGWLYEAYGDLHSKLSQSDSVFFSYFKSLEIREKHRSNIEIARSLNRLGTAYEIMGMPDSAFNYLNKSVSYLDENPDSLLLSLNYSSIAIVKHVQRDYKETIRYLNLSLPITRQLRPMSITLAKALNTYASALNKQGLYERAFNAYEESLTIKLLYGDSISIGITYNNMGSSMKNQKRYKEAIPLYEKCLEYFDQRFLAGESVVYKNLASVHDSLGNQGLTVTFLNKHLELVDTLEKVGRKRAIAEAEKKYEADKKTLELELTTTELEMTEKQNRYILLAALATLIGLLIYVIMSRRIFLRDRKMNSKKIDDLLQQQEINSLQGVLAGQEEERQRIATDLHDKLGAILGMVKLHFSAVEERIDDLREDNKQQYDKANALLDQASSEVRNISHNLLSGVLVKFGLIPALRDLKDTVEGTGKLKINLITGDQMEARLKGEQELQIYRIVQELISNILKHAKATEATIQLNRTNGEINLLVEDNGVGFDVESARAKGGIGLKNLEARAAKLNAGLHFDSGKGAGTTVSVDIPIEEDIL